MQYVSHLTCTSCGRLLSPEPGRTLCACGGVLDVRYDYQQLRRDWDRDRLKENKDFSMWRYMPLLPVDPNTPRPPLRVGWTPVYYSAALSRELGLSVPVIIKDDGLNPTGSLKDRASALAVVKAAEAHATILACSSTGNAASSLAGNVAAMPGMQAVIFVPARAPQGKVAQLLIYGARVISVQGSYRDAFELSAAAIRRWGWYNRNAAINPYLSEGKKTVALELAEQLNWQMPDWLVLSVGDGCTLAGAGKALYDLAELGFIDKAPRLAGVQAAGCAPIYKAFASGRDLEPEEENTLADSIAVGFPRNPGKALKAVKDTGGTFVCVEDAEILEAMQLLGRTCGVFAEPASAAGFAGLARLIQNGTIDQDAAVAVVSTGNGLKDIANALKIAGEPVRVPPDLNNLEKIVKEWQR